MNVGMCFTPRPARWPKMGWFETAISALGHRVFQFDDMTGLERADAECEVIIFEHRHPGVCHPNHLVEFAPHKKAKWIQISFDTTNFSDEQVFESNARVMRLMDLELVKEHSLLHLYHQAGVKAEYMDTQGCPADMPEVEHHNVPEFDVCIFGTCISGEPDHYRTRREDVQCLRDAGLRVAWATDTPTIEGISRFTWMEPMELPSFMSKAAVTLDVAYRHDIPGYWSDRLWLALGAGACVVRRHTAMQPPLPYYSYRERDEMLRIVKELVADFRLRRETGKRCRAAVMLAHTYKERAEEVMRRAKELIEAA